jgi:hypothetical protein
MIQPPRNAVVQALHQCAFRFLAFDTAFFEFVCAISEAVLASLFGRREFLGIGEWPLDFGI